MVFGNENRLVLPVFVIAGGLLLLFIGSKLWSPAGAEAELQSGGVSDIVVVPVQIERDSYGVVLVDKVGQTMCVYELNKRGPAYDRLKLLAVRSWKYDRLLEQYNTANPSPQQVKKILEELAKQQTGRNKQIQESADKDISNRVEPDGSDSGGSKR